ncbi:MAG TPA: hypothetical protein VF502_11235, partial [Stellaceae bacterium]
PAGLGVLPGEFEADAATGAGDHHGRHRSVSSPAKSSVIVAPTAQATSAAALLVFNKTQW